MSENTTPQPSKPVACADAPHSASELELMSAWMDGAAPPPSSLGSSHGHAPASSLDPSWRERWTTYHWIGEQLRATQAPALPGSIAFADAVLARLATEASPAAPPIQAANDAHWHWKAWASVASVAVLAVLLWPLAYAPFSALPANPQAQAPAAGTPQATVAAVPVAPAAAAESLDAQTPAPPFERDPQLDAMLAAHRDWGSVNALHMPVGFMRNATYTRSSP